MRGSMCAILRPQAPCSPRAARPYGIAAGVFTVRSLCSRASSEQRNRGFTETGHFCFCLVFGVWGPKKSPLVVQILPI